MIDVLVGLDIIYFVTSCLIIFSVNRKTLQFETKNSYSEVVSSTENQSFEIALLDIFIFDKVFLTFDIKIFDF